MQRRFQTPLLFITICICQNLYAQTDSLNEVVLPSIIFKANQPNTRYSKTPASVYQVNAPKQQNSLGANLTEVVQGIPSIQLNNRQNMAQDLQLSMRGFGARSTFGVRGIRIYVDGIPATIPDGQGQTSNIDLNSLNSVEVLTGPFSSLYGNSSGGALLSTTQEGKGRDSATVKFSSASHHTQSTALVLQGGAKKASEPAYVVSSSYLNTDGTRDHSGADKVLTNAKLTWNLEDGSKVNWITNYTKITADDPMGLTREQWEQDSKQAVAAANTFNTRKELMQVQTGVTWAKPLNDKNDLYTMAYLGQRDITQYQSIPKFVQQKSPKHAGGVIDFSRNYYGADLRWTGKELLPDITVKVGVALDAMQEDRKGYENFLGNELGVKGNIRRDEKNSLWNIDPYVQASWNFLPDWRLDTGVRYSNVHYKSQDHYIVAGNGDDSDQTHYEKVLPSVALSWQIMPKLMAYTSYAKGFEAPTFTEMAYRPDRQGGFNFALKPATSDNYEAGLKFKHYSGNYTLAAFQSKTKNDIVSANADNGRSTFRNADKTLRQGVEFSWNKKFWHDLTAQASYSYLDAKFKSTTPAIKDGTGATTAAEIPNNNRIPGVAKNQAFIGLSWAPKTGIYGGVDVRYMDQLYVNDTNTDAAPSYTVTSAHIGYAYALRDWTFNTYSRVDNVFDRNYVGSVIVNDGNARFFEPADGRNWSAGLSLTKQF